MDVFEKFNAKFGRWYEGLFGADGGELRPKDVLRKLTAAMEDNRKEGLDGKIYVPNKYILELSLPETDEREYLLSFLDEAELAAVLQKFMAQNNYQTRGPLGFTIAEVPDAERATRTEKLRVKVRFEKGEVPPAPNNGGVRGERNGLSDALSDSPIIGGGGDLPTVAAVYPEDDEPGTVPAVAWATLIVTDPSGEARAFPLTQPAVQIGRSRTAGNDLVLDADAKVSKAHARLEREQDGQWTLYDLGSTNGVGVGGTRLDGNRTLTGGDEIVIGDTRLRFEQAETPPAPAPSSAPPRRARLVGPGGEAFVLASEMLIGRAVTSDIILSDPSVAAKHARIVAPDAATYFLEDLSGQAETRINDRVLFPGQRHQLADGDTVTVGTVPLRFAAGDRPA